MRTDTLPFNKPALSPTTEPRVRPRFAFTGCHPEDVVAPPVALVAATVMAALLALVPRVAPAQTIQSGDLVLSYSPGGDVTIKVHGALLSFGGSLWAVSPDWTVHYYGPPLDGDLAKNAVVDEAEGGQRLTLHHRLGEGYPGDFEATQTFLVRPDDTLTATLTYRMTEPPGAVLEWGVAQLWASPLAGMPAHIVDSEGERDFTIPYMAKDPDIHKSIVARGITQLSIESRLGPIGIEASPGSGLALADYRMNKYSNPNRPFFWLGCYEQPIVYGKSVTKSVTIHFPKSFSTTARKGESIRESVKCETIDKALPADASRRPIIPTPKEFKPIDSRFVVSSNTKIFMGPNPGETEEKALAFLLADLQSRYGVVPAVVRDAPPKEGIPAGSIVLGEAWRFSLAKETCEKAGLALPDHGQGYALLVNDKMACVASTTGEGLFNGTTTLAQLLSVDGDSTFFHGAAIRDWPALNLRGIHGFTGKDRGDELARCVCDLMGRWKINTFVLEAEFIQWASHPEVWNESCAMSKDDARKAIAAARDNLIEIIPMVPSLGHFDWVFKSGHHLDLAEDPDRPYAYAVSNPKSYELIHDIYQEALDLFHPRYFHLGHDEVTMRGRFPWKSRDLGDMADLFLLDVNRHADWLRQRGVEAMIWGDMALAPGEAVDARNAEKADAAQRIRDGMPRDVVICDWHYDPAPPEKFTSLSLWKKDGYQVIGSGWDNPTNIANHAKACVDQKAMGYLQTTWAGYNFGIKGNEAEWKQYWSWILAAQYSWTGENTPADDLPFDVRQVFLDTCFPQPPRRFDRPGFSVDLRPAANCSLADTPDRTGWLGFGPEHDFSALRKAVDFKDPVRFTIQANDKGREAALLSGTMNPAGPWPASATFQFDPRPAASLHFLMTSSYAEQQGATCGAIEVRFQDGGADTLPLRYGVNLFAPTESGIGEHCRIAWEGKTAAGEPIRVWDLEWPNPDPSRQVAGFTVSSKTTCAAPILFAATGIEMERQGPQ